MEPEPERGRILIDRETAEPWVMVALTARVIQRVLSHTGPALPDSPFDVTNEYFPVERIEDWCRGYLEASLEHLVMWADFVVPLTLHPEDRVHHSARPAQTLARAALESASQAVWVMAPTNAREMARRHVTLVLHDWEEQGKAAVGNAAEKERLKALRVKTFATLQVDESEFRTPSYLTLVTDAARHVRGQLPSAELGDPATVERLWRASAGSAHGKQWPSIELSTTMEIDGKQYRFPDASAMSSMLLLAEKVTTYGVMRFVDYAGQESRLAELQREAVHFWYSRTPKREGAPDTLPDLPTS